MDRKVSRGAAVLASAASFMLMAQPALANHNWGWGGGWGRHHSRVDAGDVLAGVLIIGGIAAVASAASKAAKDRRYNDRRYEDGRYEDRRYDDRRYDERAEQDQRDYRGDDYRGQDYRDAPVAGARGPYSERDNRGLNEAVDRCVSEVERGSARVESVERAEREGDGWKVEGKVGGDDDFACTIDRDGRIRQVSIDGRAL